MDQLEKKNLKDVTRGSTEVIRIEESEYNSLLLQAVAVFEKARVKTAKSVSQIVNRKTATGCRSFAIVS